MLIQTFEARPLLHNAGSGGRHLLLYPHLQHLLFLHALLLHRARLQPATQRPIQEASPPALQSLARARGSAHLGELQDASAQATHGVDAFQAPGDPRLVSVKKLQA